MVNSQGGGASRHPSPQGGPPPAGPAAPGPTADLPPPEKHQIVSQVVNEQTGKPIAYALCELLDAGKAIAREKSDWQGMVTFHVPKPGTYTVKVVELPPPPAVNPSRRPGLRIQARRARSSRA